jgi:hypothetical protein
MGVIGDGLAVAGWGVGCGLAGFGVGVWVGC